MIHVRCPICSTSFEIDRIDDLPSFPFCSDRCKLIDLGRWIDGAYAIPGPPTGNEKQQGKSPNVNVGGDEE
jgi:endogenous inhibitor of DNA gyrase (YacG/DUF329 family)